MSNFQAQSGMSDLAISDSNILNSTVRQSRRLQHLDDEEENVVIGESPFEVIEEVRIRGEQDRLVRVHSKSSLDAEENRDSVVVRSSGHKSRKGGNNSQGTSPYKEIGRGLHLNCQISPVEPIKVTPYRAPSDPRMSNLTAAAGIG